MHAQSVFSAVYMFITTIFTTVIAWKGAYVNPVFSVTCMHYMHVGLCKMCVCVCVRARAFVSLRVRGDLA